MRSTERENSAYARASAGRADVPEACKGAGRGLSGDESGRETARADGSGESAAPHRDTRPPGHSGA